MTPGPSCTISHHTIFLLDVDPLGGGRRCLGNDDVEDAVLHAGLDGVLVHSGREGEGPMKLADGAFGDPVSRLGLFAILLVGLGDLLVLGAGGFLLGLGGCALFFDAGFVEGRGVVGFGDAALGAIVPFVVLALDTPLDD